MKKVFIIPALFCLAFVGCDVRNTDTQATNTENSLRVDEVRKNNQAIQPQQVSKPFTSCCPG